GIEQAGKLHLDPLAEEHMRHVLGMAVGDQGAGRRRADLVERSSDAVRIARELHAGGVGEELALARGRGLDEAREKEADITDQQQREAAEEYRHRALAVAAAA